MPQPVEPTPHGRQSLGIDADVERGDQDRLTGEAVALDVRTSGVILSAAGAIIDVLVSALVFVGGALLFQWLGGSVDEALGRAIAITGAVLCFLVLPMLVEILSHGRSLGRLAIGARIVRDDGGAIQLRHAFVRALMGVVEIYLTFGALAITTGLLNDRAKRLGDLLAGTHSQLERVAPRVPVQYLVPAPLAQWALIADAARLPDALSRRIAQFLEHAGRLTPSTRARVGDELAREAAAYVSPLPDAPAEAFLVALAAIRRDRSLVALEQERRGLERLEPVLTGLPRDFPVR